MNFFEEQARARSQSRRLLIAFVLAVLVMVVVIDLAVLFAFTALGSDQADGQPPDRALILIVTSVAVVGVIGLASRYKIVSLSSGGAAVAHSLGAVLVAPDSGSYTHRRLRNVVEEMAIASGTPVPQIFVLEGEAGINAFASGYSVSDAAVTVTRGALDKLSRDELQGVIAHEFSHVLNGDMRLNIRLMGLLFGLLVLGVIGRKLLHVSRGGGSSRNGGGIYVVALGVMLAGYVGLFCGRLIKAGVSRSREYLADASAVQFTRQTVGLAGALKKAAGVSAGTRLTANSGEEVAHMLFGDGVGYSRLFATHPPLLRRIARLDPGFRADALPQLAAGWNAPGYQPVDEMTVAAPGAAGLMGAAQAVDARAVVNHVGHPGDDHYRAAYALREDMPEPWLTAAHDDGLVTVLVLALLVHDDGVIATLQHEVIRRDCGARTAQEVARLKAQPYRLHRGQRLPLLSMAMPSLRRQPVTQLEALIRTVDALTSADGRIDISEYALSRLLRDELAEVLTPRDSVIVGRLKLDQVEPQISLLLALLARHGQTDLPAARRAFLAGMQRVLPQRAAAYQPPQDWMSALDAALVQLNRLHPAGKALLVEGMVTVLMADGRISITEAELLRAICGSLHLPVPPLL